MLAYKLKIYAENKLDELHALRTNRLHRRLLVLITNYDCTLKCKHCGNLVPYIKNKERYDVDVLKKDIDNLSDVLFVNHVQLQGGEPLLHPQLDKIIEHLSKSKLTRHINMATNGTLTIPDKMLKTFRDCKVNIKCATYNTKHQKIQKLKQQCEENDINLHIFDVSNSTWFDFGGINTTKDNNNIRVQKRFDGCGYKTCYTLSDGLFTKCSRAPTGHLTGLHPFYPTDHVNVRKNKNTLKHRLKLFLDNKHFLGACRYCRYNYYKEVIAGEQIKDDK